MWRNRFGRGFGPVVWQITDDDDDDDIYYSLSQFDWYGAQAKTHSVVTVNFLAWGEPHFYLLKSGHQVVTF